MVRGGNALFHLLGALHSGFSQDYACGVAYADNRFFLDLTDNRIFEALEESAKWSGERQILNAMLKPGDTFVDLGANHGSYSLVAAHLVGPTGFVAAFEPQPRLSRLVEESLRRTGACPYKVFAAGCSDRSRSAEFFIPSHASGSAGVFRGFSGSSRHKKINIALTTLDESLVDIPIRQSLFLKIDVEGSEYDALIGAGKTIERHRPAILFEVNPRSATAAGHGVRELFELLCEMGYSSVCEIDEFPQRRPIRVADDARQRNLLALHESA